MFTIGEFSKITGLSIKTLRFYHEKGLLAPSCVDDRTGYRYYDRRNIEKARVVGQLRAMEFSVAEIKEVLDRSDDEADIIEYLERHKRTLDQRVERYRAIVASLNQIISSQREAQKAMQDLTFQVEEKVLPAMLIAGVRMKGKYSECGKGFAKVCRAFGRHACGKVFCLYYDGEYREDDADFETCVPIRRGKEVEGISVRQLPGGRCVALLHQGPYEELGRSYAKVLDYVKQNGYEVVLPTREVYLKGPGMILRGNPKRYLTEIQMVIADLKTTAAATSSPNS